eukprot:CAMPEP_0117558748 /NCGR_PEP_ID=MMETSP0784-20121206/53002_1 /TAXON_ID=39447 /ORGANISM="" /LENGTH=743 /DNA_ID=CAMNT_0005356099 /DNA_START=86 /DNA_END=2318 /DNA_ORIENTATION=+
MAAGIAPDAMEASNYGAAAADVQQRPPGRGRDGQGLGARQTPGRSDGRRGIESRFTARQEPGTRDTLARRRDVEEGPRPSAAPICERRDAGTKRAKRRRGRSPVTAQEPRKRRLEAIGVEARPTCRRLSQEEEVDRTQADRDEPSASASGVLDSRLVYFSSADSELSNADLVHIFELAGSVRRLKVFQNRSKGLPRGNGICEYHTRAGAAAALRELCGALIGRTKLRVQPHATGAIKWTLADERLVADAGLQRQQARLVADHPWRRSTRRRKLEPSSVQRGASSAAFFWCAGLRCQMKSRLSRLLRRAGPVRRITWIRGGGCSFRGFGLCFYASADAALCALENLLGSVVAPLPAQPLEVWQDERLLKRFCGSVGSARGRKGSNCVVGGEAAGGGAGCVEEKQPDADSAAEASADYDEDATRRRSASVEPPSADESERSALPSLRGDASRRSRSVDEVRAQAATLGAEKKPQAEKPAPSVRGAQDSQQGATCGTAVTEGEDPVATSAREVRDVVETELERRVDVAPAAPGLIAGSSAGCTEAPWRCDVPTAPASAIVSSGDGRPMPSKARSKTPSASARVAAGGVCEGSKLESRAVTSATESTAVAPSPPGETPAALAPSRVQNEVLSAPISAGSGHRRVFAKSAPSAALAPGAKACTDIVSLRITLAGKTKTMRHASTTSVAHILQRFQALRGVPLVAKDNAGFEIGLEVTLGQLACGKRCGSDGVLELLLEPDAWADLSRV